MRRSIRPPASASTIIATCSAKPGGSRPRTARLPTRRASASASSASRWHCSSITASRSESGHRRCGMSSGSDAADILGLSAAAWTPPALHAADRIWLETNCYVDLWAELLPVLGHSAEAALAFTVRQDFEGDQVTFFKFPLEDLQTLFGLSVQELSIYDTVEGHTIAQLQRGRPVLVEVDSHWLPDAGPSYRKTHGKTTVAAIAMDRANRRLGYFHNAGYHELSDEDYDGLFRKPPSPDYLFPYVEFVKRDGPALTGD